MKVCHLIDSLAEGGAESLIVDIVDQSAAEHVVCYFRQIDPLAKAVRDAGGKTVLLDQRTPYDPRSLYRLWRTLSDESPDVLHLHLPYPRTVGRIVGTIASVDRIVTTYHNTIDAYRGSIAHTTDPLFGRLDDAAVCVSDGVREGLEGRIPTQRWETIHNGIDIESFEQSVNSADYDELRRTLGVSSEESVILSVGRYVEQKSHRTLVRAMPSVLESNSETHLVLVGWGPLEDELRETADRLGVGESVTVTGQVPHVHGYYALADLFAIASSFEGFGIVALEAMASRLPIVGSDVTALNEVIEDGETGVLVQAGEPEEFASAIISMLNADSTRFSERGYERAQSRFSLDGMVTAYDDLYQSLADSR